MTTATPQPDIDAIRARVEAYREAHEAYKNRENEGGQYYWTAEAEVWDDSAHELAKDVPTLLAELNALEEKINNAKKLNGQLIDAFKASGLELDIYNGVLYNGEPFQNLQEAIERDLEFKGLSGMKRIWADLNTAHWHIASAMEKLPPTMPFANAIRMTLKQSADNLWEIRNALPDEDSPAEQYKKEPDVTTRFKPGDWVMINESPTSVHVQGYLFCVEEVTDHGYALSRLSELGKKSYHAPESFLRDGQPQYELLVLLAKSMGIPDNLALAEYIYRIEVRLMQR